MTIDPMQPLTPELLARAIDPVAWLVFDEKGESPYQGDTRPWYLTARDASLAHATRMIGDLVNNVKLELAERYSRGDVTLNVEDQALNHLS